MGELKPVEDKASAYYRKKNRRLDLDRKTDPLAVWSFFTPMAAFFTIGIPIAKFIAPILAIAAIILGIASIIRIGENPKLKGMGYAIAGIAMGSVIMGLVLTSVFIWQK